MPSGLQIYDQNGNLTLDMTDTTAKYLGQVEIGATGSSTTQTGTITNDGFLLGQLWWLSTLQAANAYSQKITVSISGNTLTWTVGASTPAITLFYGVI